MRRSSPSTRTPATWRPCTASRTYPDSFFDSGSGAMYFGTREFPICSRTSAFYCPDVAANTIREHTGVKRLVRAVTSSVANADMLFSANPSFTAFSDIAARAE